MITTDVLIIGAGAAGLMCAAQAGYRGKNVIVVDMGKKTARKILISGGGRCNFTNQGTTPNHFICQNPHFVKSALSRFVLTSPNIGLILIIAVIVRKSLMRHYPMKSSKRVCLMKNLPRWWLI